MNRLPVAVEVLPLAPIPKIVQELDELDKGSTSVMEDTIDAIALLIPTNILVFCGKLSTLNFHLRIYPPALPV